MADIAEQSKKISSNIKRLRGDLGWTQARLAEEARISGAALSKIESGQGRIPTIVVLKKLASALEVTVNEITGEEQNPRNEDEQKYSSFYRKWKLVDDLPEEDQQRLREIAERLKGITRND